MAGNAQATVLWTAPTVSAQTPITDYIVQFSSNSGSTWNTFSDGTSTSTSATVTGLTNSTAYVFRVAAVNGVGTGTYTAASSSVTPTAGDALWANVQLLLPGDTSVNDASSYSRSVTAVGNATQSTAQSKWGGKSAAFDGSGDYLTAAVPAFGSSDFVVEMWAYFTSIPEAYTGLFDARAAQGRYPTLILNGSSIAFFTNSSFAINGGTVTTGQWHHIALARSSGTTRLYLNGSQTGSAFTDSNNYLSATSLVIGSLFDGYGLNGYIDDLRITVGSARGMTGSTITVPAAAFPTVGSSGVATDGYFSSVSLLLHGNGNLTDSSSYGKTLSTTGTVSTAGAAKYGSASLGFSGAGKVVVPSDSSITFDGDFTIECWVNFSAKPSNYIALFAGSSGATQMFLTTKQTGNGLRWGLSDTAEYASGDFTWATGTWYHVAVRRASNAVTLWVDGTNITTGTPTNGTTYTGGMNLFGGIGSVTDFSGLVDEFRITKGVARTITVPTAAFPTA